jgi:hypothetical protein
MIKDNHHERKGAPIRCWTAGAKGSLSRVGNRQGVGGVLTDFSTENPLPIRWGRSVGGGASPLPNGGASVGGVGRGRR